MTDVPDMAAAESPSVPTTTPRLALRGVSKSYEGIHALADVSFDVAPGKIHALVGENGAGKSTLVKIVTGLVAADSGQVLLDGTPVRFHSPMEARKSGISAVYQDPQLFPHLDVAENIFMETFPLNRYRTIDRRTMYAEAGRLLSNLGVNLNPRALVAGLSVADMQFVGIARALSSEVRLMFLDEPTASITPNEAHRLFEIMRRLRDQGASLVFISHRLEELSGFVDTVTVLRDGRHVETLPASQADHAGIVRLMVGRPFASLYARSDKQNTAGEEKLRVEDLGVAGKFSHVSFSVHAGEVVTMAGLVGAGRTEIALAIFGVTPPTSGRVYVNGQEVRVTGNRKMLKAGVAYLPEDRDTVALITRSTIARNIALPILDRLARLGIVRRALERETAQRYAGELQIKMSSVDQVVSALSGGNRQKVALAKWLATNPSVLILDEPTHGIDVATKAQVHELVAELAAQGLAILQISSDLPEVLATSDRILVVSHGRLTAEFSRSEATEEKIMLAATTGKDVVAA
jgi:rhamnose transport system ATP-binding protein